MSDADVKPEYENGQNRDEAHDDGGDDAVREGPLRDCLYASYALWRLDSRKPDLKKKNGRW